MLDTVAGQVRQVREAFAQSGVTFCYGENWVHAPPIAKLDRLTRSGSDHGFWFGQ